jgi:hypothetical protein
MIGVMRSHHLSKPRDRKEVNEMKLVGFTGTRRGMTPDQRSAVRLALREFAADGSEFHHGDCVGADEEAAAIARELGYKIVGHPPSNDSKRAFVIADEEWKRKDYITRNHDIVNAVDVMIAAPRETKEVLRSGTWATIRYAQKRKVPMLIVKPKLPIPGR